MDRDTEVHGNVVYLTFKQQQRGSHLTTDTDTEKVKG